MIKRIMNRIPTMWKKEENSLKTKERGGSIGFSGKVWLVYNPVVFDVQGTTLRSLPLLSLQWILVI